MTRVEGFETLDPSDVAECIEVSCCQAVTSGPSNGGAEGNSILKHYISVVLTVSIIGSPRKKQDGDKAPV